MSFFSLVSFSSRIIFHFGGENQVFFCYTCLLAIENDCCFDLLIFISGIAYLAVSFQGCVLFESGLFLFSSFLSVSYFPPSPPSCLHPGGTL